MPNLTSSIGTSNGGIPIINQASIGKAAGLHMHFPTMAAFTAAIVNERANVTGGSPTWTDGQPISISGEPYVCKRIWSSSVQHARTVLLSSTVSVVLASDANIVYPTSGLPSNSIGANNDLALDASANNYYTKTSGSWSLTGSIAPSGSIPVPIVATASIPFNTYTEMLPMQLNVDTLFVPITAGAKQGGSANLDVVVTDITKRVTFDPAFLQFGNDTPDYTLNRVQSYTFFRTGTSYWYSLTNGRTLDVTPPTYVSQVITNASKSQIKVTMSETLGPWLGSNASVTLTNAGGRTVTGVVISGSDVLINVSLPFDYTDAPSVAITAGVIQDIANNLAAALTTTAVTNQITRPARTVTFANANSTTTMNPPSDGGSGFIYVGNAVWGIRSGKGYCVNDPQQGLALLDTGNVNSSQYLQIALTSTDDYPAIVFRATPDGQNFLRCVIHIANQTIDLQIRVNGADSEPIPFTDGGWAALETIKIEPRVVDDTVQIWIASPSAAGGAFRHITALDYTIVNPELRTGTYFGIQNNGAGNNYDLISIG